MMFSVERKRYCFPNMPVTEQKEQSKGQPRDVWTGMEEIFVRRAGSGLRRENPDRNPVQVLRQRRASGCGRPVRHLLKDRLGMSAKSPPPLPGVDEEP